MWINEREKSRAICFLLDWLRWGTNVTKRRNQLLEQPRLRCDGWVQVMSIDAHGTFYLDIQVMHAL